MLKIQFPHPECEHEERGGGQGAVQLLASDQSHHALLIERCEPGNHLSSVGIEEALEVFTELLPRLWINANDPSAGPPPSRPARRQRAASRSRTMACHRLGASGRSTRVRGSPDHSVLRIRAQRKCVVSRLDNLRNMLGLNQERARLWAFAQTLAWAFDRDRGLARHVVTARWLWQA